MTRVSTFGHNQSLISELLRNQSQMYTDQQQVNTGKKSNDYKGMAGQTTTLLGAKTLQTRINQYTSAGSQIGNVMDIYDNSIGVLDTVTSDLKGTLDQALANDEVYGFGESLSQSINSAITALNTQVNGKYIFSGTKTDVPTVGIQSLSDLQSLPTAADAFQNNQQKSTAQIDDGVGMQYGILGNDVAGPLMDVMKALADFNAGPNGPIDGKLTNTQRTFIQTQLNNIETARQTIVSSQVENGVRQNRLADVMNQHKTTGNVVTGLISDIEDVDMATAVTNLSNDQTALQASYQIMAKISQLSLLNFL